VGAVALRERIDRLERSLVTLDGAQAERFAGLETRTAAIEARETQSARQAETVAAVRADVVRMRRDVAALKAEAELDLVYRERLERLESVVAAVENGAEQPRSIEEIWAWYVAQRDEILLLGKQLHTGVPQP
jgi:hypothetical protein